MELEIGIEGLLNKRNNNSSLKERRNKFLKGHKMKFILDQILDVAEKNGINAVLNASGVYDKTIPSEAAVRLFDYFICRLADKRIITFIRKAFHKGS